MLSISRAGRGQLVKMLITLEPHGICRSNFAYACVFPLACVTAFLMDKALLSISRAGRAQLVKISFF